MTQLENELLTISITAAGAELERIYHRQHKIEYLWIGDPEHWGKHAPVLFPIVGSLKENTYYFEGQAYNLPRHGFAREKDFKLLGNTKTSASFELHSDKLTRQSYPFEYNLRIHYTLENNKLVNRYEVVNKDNKPIYFSIGGHPAFNLPLHEGLSYSDYYLQFDTPETTPRWHLHQGLIKTRPETFLNGEKEIFVHHNLFIHDAIVLKNLRSKTISLKSNASVHGLTMNIEEFPYLGIWAAPDAPFICVEPWHGLADSLHHNQQLTTKEGIISLEPGKTWSKAWDITFF